MNTQTAALLVVFLIGYLGVLGIKLGGYLVLVIAGIIVLDLLHLLNATLFFYLIGIVGVYFGFATYSLFMCIMGGRGMYEWGVRTMTGALTYDNMEDYEIDQRKKNKGLSIKFKPKSGIFNATQIMFINYDDNDEINKIARVNVGRENGKSAYSYAPKPKKKKRGKKRK